MDQPDPDFVTAILNDVATEDRSVVGQMLPPLYAELRRIAGHLFSAQPPNHTLQPTAVVHEAYLKLADRVDVHWNDRRHFLALAAKIMRELLADYARRRTADKRGGGARRVTLVEDAAAATPGIDLLDFHEALSRLESLNKRHASVIELQFLAGLKSDEIAEHLGVSRRTVELDLRAARAWLRVELDSRESS